MFSFAGFPDETIVQVEDRGDVMVARLNVNINDETHVFLQERMETDDQSATEVTRRAFGMYKYVLDAHDQGKLVTFTEVRPKWWRFWRGETRVVVVGLIALDDLPSEVRNTVDDTIATASVANDASEPGGFWGKLSRTHPTQVAVHLLLALFPCSIVGGSV